MSHSCRHGCSCPRLDCAQHAPCTANQPFGYIMVVQACTPSQLQIKQSILWLTGCDYAIHVMLLLGGSCNTACYRECTAGHNCGQQPNTLGLCMGTIPGETPTAIPFATACIMSAETILPQACMQLDDHLQHLACVTCLQLCAQVHLLHRLVIGSSAGAAQRYACEHTFT